MKKKPALRWCLTCRNCKFVLEDSPWESPIAAEQDMCYTAFMRCKQRFLKYHSLFYGLICLLANVLAMFSADLTNFPMPDTEPLMQWHRFLKDHAFVINVLEVTCYLVPIILCVQYALKAKDREENDPVYIEVMVHLPGAFALRGIMGWVCNAVLEFITLVYMRIVHNLDIMFILISSGSSFLFLSIFTFTIIYFTLETLNRNFVLPSLYPDGGISHTERQSLSSIKSIFLFYFFSAGIFPTAYLGIRLFFTKRYNLVIPSYSDFLFIAIQSFVGLVMTRLITGYFQKPLSKLTDSANEISKGNYDCKTHICSNDEMGVLGDTFNDMAASLKEKEFMRDTFGKVVTPQVRDYFLDGNVALGGETLDITVMFCDIRGFTSLSESMAPKDVVALLNRYFTGLEKCISAHGGVINKYIGDAVMALFGAPVRSEHHAADAFAAAMDMKAALVEMNKGFRADGMPEIRFGIGLHSGPVLAGNIGAASRMEYTVIGDTVNTASRIEGLCKTYGKDLLVSESTAAALSENKCTFVADAEIRGRKEKVRLYTLQS